MRTDLCSGLYCPGGVSLPKTLPTPPSPGGPTNASENITYSCGTVGINLRLRFQECRPWQQVVMFVPNIFVCVK